MKRLILLLIFSIFVAFLIFNQKSNVDETQNNSNKISIIPSISPTITKTKVLNSKYLIKTAFIQQAPEKKWDEPWQDACEEASLLTVDYFYRNIKSVSIEENRDAILKMIEFENTQNFTSDVNISQMAIISEKYLKYQTKIINDPTIEDIKKYIVQNIPIIIPANGKILYQENKHFSNGGPYYHNLVILGYDDISQKFIVHDVGTKAGSYFRYSYNLLMESIHDFPNSNKKEDINNGKKRILILLK